MPVGKGGNSGNQSGSYSGTTSNTSTGTSSGETTVNPTDLWTQGSQQLFGTYGAGGLTPEQQAAMATLNPNAAKTNSGIDYANSVLKNYVGDNYKTPTSAGAPQVSASTAYSMADPYRQAYGTGVLDPALADYDTGVARSANAFRAGNIAGGSQGGAYGSNPVGAGVLAGEAARGRGALSSQIRSGILDKSFGFGGADAGMKLGADTTNAANTLQNNQFNANQQSRADAQSIGVAQNYINDLFRQNGMDSSAANQIFNMSGGGLNQIIASLGTQVPAFGQTATGTNSNTSTGNASGTSTGSSSGKNGGISAG